MPALVLRYERDEIARVFAYGCVVEMWDHVVGRQASGSKKRKYHAAFTAAERKTIGLWHTRFHAWHCVSGPPKQLYFRKASTVRLLQRAAHFFATV